MSIVFTSSSSLVPLSLFSTSFLSLFLLFCAGEASSKLSCPAGVGLCLRSQSISSSSMASISCGVFPQHIQLMKQSLVLQFELRYSNLRCVSRVFSSQALPTSLFRPNLCELRRGSPAKLHIVILSRVLPWSSVVRSVVV